MSSAAFEVRPYPKMWAELDMDVPRFDKARQMLAVLTDRYMRIDCSCFTPNDECIEQILKEYQESKAQGILHYSLQFCHTYNIEEIKAHALDARFHFPGCITVIDISGQDSKAIARGAALHAAR